MFKIIKKSKKTNARLGVLNTAHGRIRTPFFMPDATRGFIRTLSNRELEDIGIESMVINTYHLFLQPKMKIIKKAGGAHNFMRWNGPLLSDSGGFQIFSLIRQARAGKPLGKITDEGATFRSPLDGSLEIITPEKAIQIQFDLGVDMMVCLDDCPPNDASRSEIEESVERTIKWAKRCKSEYDRNIKKIKIKNHIKPLLFAVVQGGQYLDLRAYCVKELVKMDFDGYGFGARHVDKDGKFLEDVLKHTADLIPDNSLRFALGIGLPEDIVRCVNLGWDMFDCVIPTREGRHGRLFCGNKQNDKLSKNFYKTINITNSKFSQDFGVINPASKILELRQYSKAYLHHLFKLKESLGQQLASVNNLEFYVDLMERIKRDIAK